MTAPRASRPICRSSTRCGSRCCWATCGRATGCPTVKDVAGDLAINPNTVVKAYRQLEHEGLAGGRPGQGTFITAASAPALRGAQEALRESLEQWFRDADAAGLNDEAVTALIAVVRQDLRKEKVS